MPDDYEAQRDAEAEAEGQPDLADARPDEEIVLPGESPDASQDYGTTASEQATPEALDDRLSRELPEEVDPQEEKPVGRLVEPESEVDELDETSEMVAMEDESDQGPLSPEEQAMHVEDKTS
jgi:uncharacterized protein DUF5709